MLNWTIWKCLSKRASVQKGLALWASYSIWNPCTLSIYSCSLTHASRNCGLCMRWCLACSRLRERYNAHLLLHAGFVTMSLMPAPSIMCNCKLPSLPLSCSGYNFLLTRWDTQEYSTERRSNLSMSHSIYFKFTLPTEEVSKTFHTSIAVRGSCLYHRRVMPS